MTEKEWDTSVTFVLMSLRPGAAPYARPPSSTPLRGGGNTPGVQTLDVRLTHDQKSKQIRQPRHTLNEWVLFKEDKGNRFLRQSNPQVRTNNRC